MDQGSNMIRQTDPHDNGMYHAQVYHRMGKQWYSIQDLSVQEVPHEIITKSEVLMLLYERKDVLNWDWELREVGESWMWKVAIMWAFRASVIVHVVQVDRTDRSGHRQYTHDEGIDL